MKRAHTPTPLSPTCAHRAKRAHRVKRAWGPSPATTASSTAKDSAKDAAEKAFVRPYYANPVREALARMTRVFVSEPAPDPAIMPYVPPSPRSSAAKKGGFFSHSAASARPPPLPQPVPQSPCSRTEVSRAHSLADRFAELASFAAATPAEPMSGIYLCASAATASLCLAQQIWSNALAREFPSLAAGWCAAFAAAAAASHAPALDRLDPGDGRCRSDRRPVALPRPLVLLRTPSTVIVLLAAAPASTCLVGVALPAFEHAPSPASALHEPAFALPASPSQSSSRPTATSTSSFPPSKRTVSARARAQSRDSISSSDSDSGQNPNARPVTAPAQTGGELVFWARDPADDECFWQLAAPRRVARVRTAHDLRWRARAVSALRPEPALDLDPARIVHAPGADPALRRLCAIAEATGLPAALCAELAAWCM
jgi:hypothetical protein